jgi:hypothetical protein
MLSSLFVMNGVRAIEMLQAERSEDFRDFVINHVL